MDRRTLILSSLAMIPTARAWSQIAPPSPKPVPRVQAIPLPRDEVALLRDGVELTRYHADPALRRPFLYPINGPSGRSLTRMGHPRDPIGHSHHNSVWISHHDVDGESFWGDRAGRIVSRGVVRFEDGDTSASLVARNDWLGKGDRPILDERRGVTVRVLDPRDWLLILDIQLDAAKTRVTLGPTPFGPIGVRMAKTIGVNDGGGVIRNSEGNVNESGPDGVFRKRARWVDYSGLMMTDTFEGITLLDHPSNPRHPAPFHVRDDGWMGACLTLDAPLVIEPGRTLRLRYGLFVHGGVPIPATIEARWREFAGMAVVDLPAK